MADVVSSSEFEAEPLRKQLKELTESCNTTLSEHILSPYTITLGDEFQGIASSLESAIKTIFFFEEESLRKQNDFKLHYALHFGKIDTKINPDIAYEMMGPGLTRTRELLTNKKRGRKRFEFDLYDETETLQFSRLFEVLDVFILSWKKEDYPLILDMIQNDNNAEVGEMYEKNRDQIWKRRRTLMINEYNQLKDFILTYIQQL
jgi:hypothetical protein